MRCCLFYNPGINILAVSKNLEQVHIAISKTTPDI